MKHLLIVAFSIAFSTTYSQGIEDKLWRLEYAKIDGREVYYSQTDLTSPTILFYNNKIRGNTGCNAYHTTYEYVSTNEINIGRLDKTKMSCPNLYLKESDYINAIQSLQIISLQDDIGICIFKNLKGDTLRFFLQGEKQ